MKRRYLVVLVWVLFLYNPLLLSSSRTYEPVSRVYSTMALPDDVAEQRQNIPQETLNYNHDREHFEEEYSRVKFNYKALFFGFHMMVNKSLQLQIEGMDRTQNFGYSKWYWSTSKTLPILKKDLENVKNMLTRFLDELKPKHEVFSSFNLSPFRIFRKFKLKNQISKISNLQQGLRQMEGKFKKYPQPRIRGLEYKVLQREDIPQGTCSICLDDFDFVVVKTDCDHVFHKNCLEKWFKRQHSCPYCRKDFSPIEP